MQDEGHWKFWENYSDLTMAPPEMMVRIRSIIPKVSAGGFGSCLVGILHRWDVGCSGWEGAVRSYGYSLPLNGEPVGATKSFPNSMIGEVYETLDACLPFAKLT